MHSLFNGWRRRLSSGVHHADGDTDDQCDDQHRCYTSDDEQVLSREWHWSIDDECLVFITSIIDLTCPLSSSTSLYSRLVREKKCLRAGGRERERER